MNSCSTIRVSWPPFNDSVIVISFFTSNIFWSLTWHTLDVNHGSDHFLIVIDYFSTYGVQDTEHIQVIDSRPSFCFNKADWSEFSISLSYELSMFSFSDSVLTTHENLISVIWKVASTHIPSRIKSHKLF